MTSIYSSSYSHCDQLRWLSPYNEQLKGAALPTSRTLHQELSFLLVPGRSSGKIPVGVGGGGTASLMKDLQFCATTALSHCPCWFTAPCFQGIKGQPIVITVVTVTCPQWTSFLGRYRGDEAKGSALTRCYLEAKTLIKAKPRCFPWTSQADNYSPNRKCPSDSPPPESSWVCDSPLFSSLQPQLQEGKIHLVSGNPDRP